MEMPQKPVDAVLIIGQLNQLSIERLNCLKLKVIIAILPKSCSRDGKRIKYGKHAKVVHRDFEHTQYFIFHDACGGVTDGRF